MLTGPAAVTMHEAGKYPGSSVGVSEGVREADGETDGVGEFDGVQLGVNDSDGDELADWDAVPDWDAVGLGVGDTEGVVVVLGECVIDSDCVALPDCDAEPDPEGVREGVPDGLGDPLDDSVPVREGEAVGVGVDDSDGVTDAVGLGVIAYARDIPRRGGVKKDVLRTGDELTSHLSRRDGPRQVRRHGLRAGGRGCPCLRWGHRLR